MGKTPQKQVTVVERASEASGADHGPCPGVSSFSGSASSPLWAYLALAAAMVLWSGTFILMKVALTDYHPFALIFIRMVIGTLLIAPFGVRLLKSVRYTKGDWRPLLLLVLAEPCMYFIFEGFALRYTSATQAGMIIALLPLCVGVGAFIFLRERLSPIVWAGFATAVAGVGLLTVGGEATEASPNPMLGNLLEMGAVFMATGYILCVRRLPGFPAFCIVAFQSLGGAIFFGLLTLATPGVGIPDSPGLLPTLSLVGLGFVSVFGYGFFNVGVARLSAGQASAWNNLIPGITLLMDMLFLGSRLTPLQYLALIPIFLGVGLSQLGKAKTDGG